MEAAAKSALKIGWIGTGVMGKSMVGHLMRNGYTLSVYNRTASKADELVKNGAKFVEPIELAKTSDVLFLMLGYPHDVEKVVFDEAVGVLHNMKEGSILIDHTTSSPGLAQRIAEEALKRKVFVIDAPVSGGDIGAKNGKLVTMVGGQKEAFDKSLELLNCYSAEVAHMGDAGFG
jgi:3-hydroxyisobutyrate dehydrogenase